MSINTATMTPAPGAFTEPMPRADAEPGSPEWADWVAGMPDSYWREPTGRVDAGAPAGSVAEPRDMLQLLDDLIYIRCVAHADLDGPLPGPYPRGESCWCMRADRQGPDSARYSAAHGWHLPRFDRPLEGQPLASEEPYR